jgi:hypothetical protein
MKSLKQLAEKDGVTVVSVIHQPRKFIFDLFDSLILLGVGGRMVYHGRTKDAESYFARLNYFLPSGESMADWLIDISSGRLEPESNIASNKKEERLRLYKQTNQGRMKKLNIPSTRSFGPIEEETNSTATPEYLDTKNIQPIEYEMDGTCSDPQKIQPLEYEMDGASSDPPLRPIEHEMDGTFSDPQHMQPIEYEMGGSSSAPPQIPTFDNKEHGTSSAAKQIQIFDDDTDGTATGANKTQSMFDYETNGDPYVARKNQMFDDKAETFSGAKKIHLFNNNTNGNSSDTKKNDVFDDETDGTSSSKENCGYGFYGDDGFDSVDNDSLRPRTSDDSIVQASSSEDDERDAEIGGSSEFASLISDSVHISAAPGQAVTDRNCVGVKGVTTGKVAQAFEEAKVRRAWLYDEWMNHMANLTPDQKAIYEPPEKYDLPFRVQKPLFWYQFVNQLRRGIVVASRNRFSKIIDCTIIVVAVIVITALDGTTEVAMDDNPDLAYEVMVRPVKDDLSTIFQRLFAYSMTRQIQ